ncbi:DUF3526 domain-containing protein [Gemmatimonas sp.]|uniref:DUF3526 domain-containing protein n=1 Tax=Gemmatimonas sp. TaxID=1962908 RepID=UPI00333F9A02
MQQSLLRTEWRLLAADRTPWLLLLVFGCITAYGAWNGWQWAAFQRDTLQEVVAGDRQRIARLDTLLQRQAAGDTTAVVPPVGALGATAATTHAVLPPGPLATLAVGASDLFPYYARVSIRSKQSFMATDEIENPHNLLAGRFDLAFVMVFIYPLLLLALTYNVVSGERDLGTMPLWMSQPISPRRVLMAKVAVRVGFVLAMTLGLSVTLALLTGVSLTADGALVRLALWALALLVYGLFWIAVAIAVNALGRSSATNAVLLLGVWLLVVVVVPSTIAAVVTTWYPSPSRVALTTALRRASDEAASKGDTAVSQFLADHPEMAQFGTSASGNAWARTIAQQEQATAALQPTFAAFDSALVAQRMVANRARLLSPAILMQDVLHDIAGRSIDRTLHYDAQVDRHHRAWQDFFFKRVFAAQPFGTADLAGRPTFTYAEEAASTMPARVGGLLWIMFAPTLLIGLWGVQRLRRVSVHGG